MFLLLFLRWLLLVDARDEDQFATWPVPGALRHCHTDLLLADCWWWVLFGVLEDAALGWLYREDLGGELHHLAALEVCHLEIVQLTVVVSPLVVRTASHHPSLPCTIHALL